LKAKVRINNEIRAKEVRVTLDDGGTLGVMPIEAALKEAIERGLDLVEISEFATPPVVKIIDFGKFQYIQNKKDKEAKSKAHVVEIVSLQVKIGTGDHDLALKAKKASEALAEGHRVKIELFLRGRAKYMDKKFLEERLKRVLNLITEEYKLAEGPKQSPKGLMVMIERSKH